MSDTAIAYRRRIPLITRRTTTASPSLIRWFLRITTAILFGVATAFGVSVGLNAPEISPTSVVQHHVAPAGP